MTHIDTDNPLVQWQIAQYDWMWENRAFVCAVLIIYFIWIYARFKKL